MDKVKLQLILDLEIFIDFGVDPEIDLQEYLAEKLRSKVNGIQVELAPFSLLAAKVEEIERIENSPFSPPV